VRVNLYTFSHFSVKCEYVKHVKIAHFEKVCMIILIIHRRVLMLNQ